MLKDSRRYLWFLSQDGLTRFDGTRFVNYFTSEAYPGSGPIGDTGNGLAEAANGDLWFGTEIGLNRYIRATDRFLAVYTRDKQGKVLPTLTHVFDADSTYVWYINETEGLLRLNWRTSERTLLSAAIRHSPTYDLPYIKHSRNTGEIWLLLPDDGVLCFNYKTKQQRSYFSRRPDNRSGTPRLFSAIYLDLDGSVWLGASNSSAVYKLNPQNGQTKQ